MTFKMAHNNFNVYELDKSIDFYKKALDMYEEFRIEAQDGSFIIVFMRDRVGQHKLELTWLRDQKQPYDLGDNEIHLCFVTDDYEAAYNRHKDMNCICYENTKMGLYFISDPDGYWLEISR